MFLLREEEGRADGRGAGPALGVSELHGGKGKLQRLLAEFDLGFCLNNVIHFRMSLSIYIRSTHVKQLLFQCILIDTFDYSNAIIYVKQA